MRGKGIGYLRSFDEAFCEITIKKRDREMEKIGSGDLKTRDEKILGSMVRRCLK